MTNKTETGLKILIVLFAMVVAIVSWTIYLANNINPN